jgi:hypothetical protein
LRVPGEQRGQQADRQADAHARAGPEHVDRDIAVFLKLFQVTLHGAAATVQALHQVRDGDVRRSVVAVQAVGVFGDLSGAPAGAVAQVGIVLKPGCEFGDIAAVIVGQGLGRLLCARHVARPAGAFGARVGRNCDRDGDVFAGKLSGQACGEVMEGWRGAVGQDGFFVSGHKWFLQSSTGSCPR